MEDSLSVRLKTAAGDGEMFEMDVFKESNDLGLVEKMMITLREKSGEHGEA